MSFLKNIEIQAQSRTASAMRPALPCPRPGMAALRGPARGPGRRLANAAGVLASVVLPGECRRRERTGTVSRAARSRASTVAGGGSSGNDWTAF